MQFFTLSLSIFLSIFAVFHLADGIPPNDARTIRPNPFKHPIQQKATIRRTPIQQPFRQPIRQPIRPTPFRAPVRPSTPFRSPIRPAPIRQTPRQFPAKAGIPGAPQRQNGNSIRQCLCAEIRPCKERYLSALEPCLDNCQNIVKPLGGDTRQLYQCFKQREPMLKSVIQCTKGKYENACAKTAGFTVPQRYGAENLELMATAEIDRMISKMGLQNKAKPFLGTGKRLFECVKGCMKKRSGNCEKQLDCGLSLPSNKELIESAKQCAIQGGFNTANAQQLCQCAMAAGVKNLDNNLCSRIIIS